MTLDDFLREPSREQWLREVAEHGWRCDGSSASPDAICGVRIGIKSTRYEYHELPANTHDWRYHLGRRFGLPWEWSIYADAGYRNGCLGRVLVLVGPFYWFAWMRCHARYIVLRVRAHALRLVGFPVWGGPP